MEFEINIVAVFAAAVANVMIGYAWYSKGLFGKQWMVLSGLPGDLMQKMDRAQMIQTILGGLAQAFVMAYVLAHFIQLFAAENIQAAAQLVFWVWLGFIATVQIGMVLWERKSFNLFLIHSLYHLVALTAMAIVLVLWV